MSGKPTPGPWFVFDDHPTRACLHVGPSLSNDVASLYSALSDKDEQDECGIYINDHERVANATLIAASHDLLAAAQCAANVLFLLEAEVEALGHRAGNVRGMLQAAIAKATGDQE